MDDKVNFVNEICTSSSEILQQFKDSLSSCITHKLRLNLRLEVNIESVSFFLTSKFSFHLLLLKFKVLNGIHLWCEMLQRVDLTISCHINLHLEEILKNVD